MRKEKTHLHSWGVGKIHGVFLRENKGDLRGKKEEKNYNLQEKPKTGKKGGNRFTERKQPSGKKKKDPKRTVKPKGKGGQQRKAFKWGGEPPPVYSRREVFRCRQG